MRPQSFNDTYYFSNLKSDKVDSYRESLSSKQKLIWDFLFKFDRAPFIKLKNQTIANSVDCDRKTVTRATNKFMNDGYINKIQDHTYAPNNFYISPKINTPQHTFNLWLSKLSDEEVRLYSMGIKPIKKSTVNISNPLNLRADVPLNRIYNNNIYINKKHPPIILPLNKESVFFCEQDKVVNEKVAMLKDVQKEYIIKNKKNITIEQLLEHPATKDQLITETVRKCATLLGLDPRESVKLLSYPEDVLQKAFSEATKRFQQKTGIVIKNKKAWFFGTLDKICEQSGVKPDWKFFMAICDIGGEKAFQNIPTVPDQIEYDETKYVKSKDADGNIHLIPRTYRLFEKKKEEDIETQIARLVSEKLKWEEMLANPEKNFTNSFSAEFDIKMAKARISNIEFKLASLTKQIN